MQFSKSVCILGFALALFMAEADARGGILRGIFQQSADDVVEAATRTGTRTVQRNLVQSSLKRSAHQTQASLVTANISFNGTLFRLDGVGTVTVTNLVAFLGGAGLSSSGSPDIDREVIREVAANALHGNTGYFPLVCVNGDGSLYQVPSSARSCLDGALPLTFEQALSLSSIEIDSR